MEYSADEHITASDTLIEGHETIIAEGSSMSAAEEAIIAKFAQKVENMAKLDFSSSANAELGLPAILRTEEVPGSRMPISDAARQILRQYAQDSRLN